MVKLRESESMESVSLELHPPLRDIFMATLNTANGVPPVAPPPVSGVGASSCCLTFAMCG